MAASVVILVGDCRATLEGIVSGAASLTPGKDIGPVISATAAARIRGYIEARARTAARCCWTAARRSPSPAGQEQGFWLRPTVVDGLDRHHACARDEIFGPFLTVLRVKTIDEALAIENASPYGNAASIYTSSGAAAAYFEARASAGMIGVNIGVPVPREPFGFGGWNDSRFGMGDITGRDAISFWTKTKKVTRKWNAPARDWMS